MAVVETEKSYSYEQEFAHFEFVASNMCKKKLGEGHVYHCGASLPLNKTTPLFLLSCLIWDSGFHLLYFQIHNEPWVPVGDRPGLLTHRLLYYLQIIVLCFMIIYTLFAYDISILLTQTQKI